MNIASIYEPQGLARLGASSAEKAAAPAGTRSFAEMLQQGLATVDQAQQEADDQAVKLVSGKADNLHDVVIAAEEAALTLSLTVQVRNKAVEAYQEIMRMQI
jgi:flagellar hook-basal body complex protein FliE